MKKDLVQEEPLLLGVGNAQNNIFLGTGVFTKKLGELWNNPLQMTSSSLKYKMLNSKN